MAIRRWVGRFLGLALLFSLAVGTVTVLLDPNLWWFLLLSLMVLWMFGFSFSHAYVLAHDGSGPRPR